MRKVISLITLFMLVSTASHAQSYEEGSGVKNAIFKSITVEGGPIATKHFQSGDDDFRETHILGIVKAHTYNYGNWGLYYLGPNSVDDYSYGFGYVTNPYVLPLGPVSLELSGALGLVTGYQDYPVPLLAAEIRLPIYQGNQWNVGFAMAAMPYILDNDGDNEFGIVATSPFLSARYEF